MEIPYKLNLQTFFQIIERYSVNTKYKFQIVKPNTK